MKTKTKNKVINEILEKRELNPTQKYFVRGILLPIAGFFLFSITYTTYIGPFLFLAGGWYLNKWWMGRKNNRVIEDNSETGETAEVEYNSQNFSKSWRNTDSNE